MLPYHPLDQDLIIEDTHELDYVDEVMESAIRELNPEIVFNYLVETQRQFQIRGLALCKLLYLLNENWSIFQLGDNFYDSTNTITGLARHTIDRYVKIWRMITDAPPIISRQLQQKGVNILAPVANAISQGYELEPQDWEKVIDAPDARTASKFINDLTGKEPRSNRLDIYMDRTGALWANTKTDNKFIGSMEIDDESDIVQAAIERIIRSAGVLKQ